MRPTLGTDPVATAQRLRGVGSNLLEGLEANWAFFLVIAREEFKLLLEAFECCCHRPIVAVGHTHHVENKPLARLVGDPHGFLRVDLPEPRLHLSGDGRRHLGDALLVKIEQCLADFFHLLRVALVQLEFGRALGSVLRLVAQLVQQLVSFRSPRCDRGGGVRIVQHQGGASSAHEAGDGIDRALFVLVGLLFIRGDHAHRSAGSLFDARQRARLERLGRLLRRLPTPRNLFIRAKRSSGRCRVGRHLPQTLTGEGVGSLGVAAQRFALPGVRRLAAGLLSPVLQLFAAFGRQLLRLRLVNTP
mmetsp:Transcript_119489/g.234832  ORF Transcript_119489/g.234832 Transcript_119489/m.234832 type:complete len:303 (+) Transcript_119489:194-1102(+)